MQTLLVALMVTAGAAQERVPLTGYMSSL